MDSCEILKKFYETDYREYSYKKLEYEDSCGLLSCKYTWILVKTVKSLSLVNLAYYPYDMTCGMVYFLF